MRKLFLLILLLTLALAPCASARMTSVLVGGGVAAGGYTLTESFDGPGDISCYAGYSNNCDNTWDAIFGTPDFDYSDNPIAGTYSARLGDGGTQEISLDFSDTDPAYFYFIVHFESVISSGASYFARFRRSTTTVSELGVNSDGKPSVSLTGGTTAYGTNGDLAAGNTYHFWVEIDVAEGAGATNVYWSTDGTKGSAKMSISNGNTSNVLNRIDFKGGATQIIRVDTIKIGSAAWGNNGS